MCVLEDVTESDEDRMRKAQVVGWLVGSMWSYIRIYQISNTTE